MTIELTANDCLEIFMLAKYAREYLKMKRNTLLETRTADESEINRIEKEIEIAGDLQVKFDRLHLTGRIVDRVLSGKKVASHE